MRNTYRDRERKLRILLSKMVDWAGCVGEETSLEELLEQKMRLERLLIMEVWHARLWSLVIVHEGEPKYVSELGRTYSETLSFRKTGFIAVVEGLQEAKLDVRKSVRRKCLLYSK